MNMITRFFVGCLCLVSISFAPLASAWAAPGSIMVFPPAIHAESSMEYIQKGVADLMETELSEKQITVTRAPSASARKDAISQAKAAKVEALILGSLTFLGDSISINLKLISPETGETLLAFSKVESDKNNLFNDITEFITQVEAYGPAAPPAVPEVSSKPAPLPAAASALSEEIIRSEDMPMEAVVLSVGDINGNGQKEIVLADSNTLTILNLQNGSFTESGRIEGPSYLKILHVDTWDTTGDGVDNIIVSAVHTRTGIVSSYAYGWDGTRYTRLCKNVNWFFKKGPCPFSMEPTLLGQQQQISDGSFDGDIWSMGWDQGKKTLSSVDPCANPLVRTNLYTYATGDLFNSGEVLTISYTPGDYLSVFKSSKEELWSSSDRFGGSSRFFNAKDQSPPKRHYLTPRIEAGDFNQDGKTDVVTLQNKNATPRMFTNLKKFVEGQVVCLTWNTLDFETQWTTRKIPGYIPDFTLADLDGDGKMELVYCVIPKKSSWFSKRKSYVVVQSLLTPSS